MGRSLSGRLLKSSQECVAKHHINVETFRISGHDRYLLYLFYFLLCNDGLLATFRCTHSWFSQKRGFRRPAADPESVDSNKWAQILVDSLLKSILEHSDTKMMFFRQIRRKWTLFESVSDISSLWSKNITAYSLFEPSLVCPLRKQITSLAQIGVCYFLTKRMIIVARVFFFFILTITLLSQRSKCL